MTTLHVHRLGQGRPLVALHGVTGHGGRFRDLARDYLPGHAVYAFDLLGHGRSRAQPPWGLTEQVDAVQATMDELGLDQVELLGFSYGGLVALHLAIRDPHRIRGLVLMDPAIGLPPQAAYQRAEAAMTAMTFSGPQEAKRWRMQMWPAATDEFATREVQEHLAVGHDGRYRWRYEPAAVVVAYSEMARPAQLPPAGMPTLLLRGLNEQVVQPEYAQACQAAGIAVVDLDSGHQLSIERPVETGTAIKDFLAGLE